MRIWNKTIRQSSSQKQCAVAACALLLLLSCAVESIGFERDVLFKVEHGFLPDQVSPIRGSDNQEQFMGQVRVSPTAQIYFSDPASQKLMMLSNYGDLLALLYSPEENLWSETVDLAEGTAWPLHSIQNFLVTEDRLYIVDYKGEEQEPGVLAFSIDNTYLYSIALDNEQQGLQVANLYTDQQNNLIIVTFDGDNWELIRFDAAGKRLSEQRLLYEEAERDEVVVNTAVLPLFSSLQVIYQKMIYRAENSSFVGGSSSWSLAVNEIWLSDGGVQADRFLFRMKPEYISATIFGRLRDDRVVMVYYQGGKMVVVPYDLQGQRGKAVALVTEQAPTRYYLASSGLLADAVYYRDYVEFGWWRLDQLWNRQRG